MSRHSWTPSRAAYFQSLIRILRWMVELGRVDICLAQSLLSLHLVLPREGYLAQLFHIFAYLKKYYNMEMVFDPSNPMINMNDFEWKDWRCSEFGHIDGQEALPPNMPTPRGQGFTILARVDTDHTSDMTTKHSRTGYIVYLRPHTLVQQEANQR